MEPGDDPAARLYLDEDVPAGAAEIGRALGLEAIAARDAHSALPQPDPVHLRAAAEGGRVLVTYNRNDFILATRDAFAAGGPHAGVLILTHKLRRDPTRVAHALARWARAHRAAGRWPMQPYEIDFTSG